MAARANRWKVRQFGAKGRGRGYVVGGAHLHAARGGAVLQQRTKQKVEERVLQASRSDLHVICPGLQARNSTADNGLKT